MFIFPSPNKAFLFIVSMVIPPFSIAFSSVGPMDRAFFVVVPKEDREIEGLQSVNIYLIARQEQNKQDRLK